ncbi:protein of unknown function [Micropruina glycogenica]|uniref:Uncharacterized protein n=1 Tax=Micropruina glycogenica TaxID=75385 RepID=A0A2N9JHP2_9ACTN|nr:protein of unknown function [Micropruina glycogenica]
MRLCSCPSMPGWHSRARQGQSLLQGLTHSWHGMYVISTHNVRLCGRVSPGQPLNQ